MFSVFLVTTKSEGQCWVSYSTSNYFCDLDSLQLHANPESGTGPFTFLWETGETTQTIMIPLAYGDYMVTMTDATGCTAIINCHVKPYPLVLYYPYNQNACEGDTVTLFLDWFRDSLPGATYLWSTGETTPTITLTDDLTWSVTVTDPSNGCEFIIEPNLFDFHEIPEIEIIGPELLCNGESVVLTVEGGPWDYVVWYPLGQWWGEYGETYTATQPGQYIAWGNSPSASWCWAKDTLDLLPGSIPPPILEGPPDLCTGQTGTISVVNSSDYVAFLWNTGETSSSIEALEPGTYFITVTDDEGCTLPHSLYIPENDGADLVTEPVSASCGQSDGSISLSATPVENYDYQWSNGSTSQDLTDVPPGTYSVTVTDVNGCTSITEDIVPDTPVDITITDNLTPNTVCENFNGAININALPVLPYTYQWSNGATTEDINNLAPGVYSVTVTTGVNCTATAEFTIEDNSNATDIAPSINPSSCGLENGSIILQLNGGSGPFTYIWSNGHTTEDLLDIGAGNYYVTVTGADGCSSSAFIELPNEDIPITLTSDILPNSSCDESNGSIDLLVSPSGTYSFNWSTGATTEDLYFLGAGTYDVTVTLGNSCTQTGSYTVANENIPFTIDGSPTPNTSCSTPNGSIDLAISPSGIYTYNWSTGAPSEDINNLGEGTYFVTVTSSDGCAISSSFTITGSSTSIDISGLAVSNTSCQVPNGSVDIDVTPAGTYSFLWSNGMTTEDINNSPAGTYSVTVTDGNGCTSTGSFTIGNESAEFTLSAIPQTNTSCTVSNGSIDLSIDPPGSYTYIWSNGSTTEDLNAMSGGNYSVTVTDANSCSSTASFTIDEATAVPEIQASIMDEVCGEANGSIHLSVTPSNSTYAWSSGETIEDLNNISAGTYIVTVTGSNGCTVIDTFTINNGSSNFTLSGTPIDNSSCSSPNGSLNLQVTPSGAYTFIWSNGATTEDLQNIDAGTYSVTVTDPFNCSSIATYNVSSNTIDPVMVETVTPATCGQINGEINITVTPPTGNTYIWSNGSNIEDLQNIGPGTYSVTVTNSNGCSAISVFTVPNNNTNFSIDGFASANTSCIASNGGIDLNILPLNTYTYAWSNGSTDSDLNNLPAGTYTVTVTDEFGCSSTSSYTIEDDSNAPTLTEIITPATCGQSNGSIEINITPNTGITFLWSDGSTLKDKSNILPGSYQLTVTDANGCSVTAQFEVPNQNSNFSIVSQVTNDTSCISPNGSINLTVSPAGAYTFLWSNGASTEDLVNLPSGVYEVTVTDHLQCESHEFFMIENTNTFPVLSEAMSMATCGNSNGRIDITVTPEAGNDFIWSTGDITEDLVNIMPGDYSVTVTDRNGCSSSSSFTLPGSDPLELTLDADLTASQSGLVTCNLQLNMPITALDSIFWFPYDLLSCYEPLCVEQIFALVEATEVMVMVRDTFGCMAQANLFLDLDDEFRVYIPNVFIPFNGGPNERFTVYANVEVEEVVELEIFDRWGNCVFINETFPPNEPAYGWDGVFKGNLMNPDVFAYRAVVRYSNGEEHSFKGDVTLVR